MAIFKFKICNILNFYIQKRQGIFFKIKKKMGKKWKIIEISGNKETISKLAFDLKGFISMQPYYF